MTCTFVSRAHRPQINPISLCSCTITKFLLANLASVITCFLFCFFLPNKIIHTWRFVEERNIVVNFTLLQSQSQFTCLTELKWFHYNDISAREKNNNTKDAGDKIYLLFECTEINTLFICTNFNPWIK